MNKIIIGIIVITLLAVGFLYFNKSQTINEPTSIFKENGASNNIIAQPSENNVPSTENQTIRDEKTKIFTIEGSNFKFSPNQLAVKKGDTIKIIFKNSDGTHDLRIDELNVATKLIHDGEEDTVTFVADKTGSFEYYCSVGSHRQMGMKGAFVVME